MFANESQLARGRLQIILRLLRPGPRNNKNYSDQQRSRSITSGSSHDPDLSFLRDYTEADLILHPDYGETMPPR
jgi:hypothetical protein